MFNNVTARWAAFNFVWEDLLASLSCFFLLSDHVTMSVYRVKRGNVPYNKEKDEEATTDTRHVAAFENPGYVSPGALDGDGEENNDNIGPVVFSPFEGLPENNAATNPQYFEIGMTRISSSESINKGGANGEPDATKASQEDAVGALPKKEPFVEEKEVNEQPAYLEIIMKKEAAAEEEVPYVSLVPHESETVNSGEINIDIRADAEKSQDESQYASIASAGGVQSDRRENGQTVLVLEDNGIPNEDYVI